jgi:hypothetical protein
MSEHIASMKRSDIWSIAGLELGQQSDLFLNIFDLLVVLVQIKRLDSYHRLRLVVDPILLFSTSIRWAAANPPLVDTPEAPLADQVDYRIGDVRRHSRHLRSTLLLGLCSSGFSGVAKEE